MSDIGVVMGHLYLGGVLDKWLPSMDRQVAHFRMTGTDVQIEGRDLHKTFVGSDPRTARFESSRESHIDGNRDASLSAHQSPASVLSVSAFGPDVHEQRGSGRRSQFRGQAG